MKRLTRILGVLLVIVLVLAIAAGGFGVYTVRRAFPRVDGRVAVPGLGAPVEVFRDDYGVPHIYADSIHDLFMAQGYVHAQERFYQMDFWRHQTAGRLSELYGATAGLGPDKFIRTLGWRRLAEQEYALAPADARAVLDAYAAGVNAYLTDRPAADLSLEYSILALNGLGGYRPDPWSPVDTLAWAKAMAWDLSGNMSGEIARANLIAAIGPDMAADYMPLFPEDHPVILPDPAVGRLPLDALQARLEAVDAALGAHFEGIGSNNWVIAGSRTDTGQPLLANDPHLAIQMPAIWFEVGLHCQPLSDGCPYDVTGFSFAGAPGVIIGHNNRIAWGMTNVGPDVQDLYIEKINPDNPNQYEVNGQWVDMTVLTETISIKGGGSEPLTIRATRHGPIVTEVYGLEDLPATTGQDAAGQYAIALRWTALEPNQTWEAIFQLNRAQNFDDFRNALRLFDVPSQNFIYADVDGNIGYQVPAHIPIRRSGDGLLPVPGWTDDYEWTGYIPFEALPYSYNPPQGYIITANNAVVGPDYPYMLSLDWDAGYRAQRLVDLIEAQPKISSAYIQQMQGDNLNLGAGEVLPSLLALSFDDPKLNDAVAELRGWDGQMSMDSRPAAIYMGFYNALLANTFDDDLPQKNWPSGGGGNWLLLRKLVQQPDSPWWDNRTTDTVETRDDILRASLAEGYAALEQRLGTNASRWTWGALHTSTFVNSTLGRSGIAAVEALFNRGPFPTAGGSSIVNATGWRLDRDDQNPAANPYATVSLPSMRMIVDLSNLDNSLTVITTGESGHAYHPHYIDMADPWRQIQYHAMLWSRSNVEARAESHQTLTP